MSLIRKFLNNDSELESFLFTCLKSLECNSGSGIGKFFILFGTGSNGKTTFLNLLREVCKPVTIPFRYLTSENPLPRMPYSGTTPIPKNRIVIVETDYYNVADDSETDSDCETDSDSDADSDSETEYDDTPINAGRLYDFMNAGNIIFYECNKFPILKGTNPALWDNSICVIPCMTQFTSMLSEARRVDMVYEFTNLIETSKYNDARVPQIVTYWTNQLKSRCMEYEHLPTFAKSVADSMTDPHSVAVSDSEILTKSVPAIATSDEEVAPVPTRLTNITILLERNPNTQEVLQIVPDTESDGFNIRYKVPKKRDEHMYVVDDDTLESYIESFFEFMNYDDSAYTRIGFRLPMMPDVWMPASRTLHYIKTMFHVQLELLMLNWPVCVE